MSELEEYEDQINKNMKKLSDCINISKLFDSDRKKWQHECDKYIRYIHDYIQASEDHINELSLKNTNHFTILEKSKVQQFLCKKQFLKLQDNYKKKNRQKARGSIDPDESQEGDDALIQTLIQEGKDTQDRTKEKIANMLGMASEGIQLADQVNLELNRQIQQLDRIQDKVKDSSSILKRSQKYLNYFARALECDKCMLGLIILIVLALIAFIVLLVKKNN